VAGDDYISGFFLMLESMCLFLVHRVIKLSLGFSCIY